MKKMRNSSKTCRDKLRKKFYEMQMLSVLLVWQHLIAEFVILDLDKF